MEESIIFSYLYFPILFLNFSNKSMLGYPPLTHDCYIINNIPRFFSVWLSSFAIQLTSWIILASILTNYISTFSNFRKPQTVISPSSIILFRTNYQLGYIFRAITNSNKSSLNCRLSGYYLTLHYHSIT